MRKSHIACTALLGPITLDLCSYGRDQAPAKAPAAADAGANKARSDADQAKKAAEWVGSLHLDDPAKEARLKQVVGDHLKAVRDWHNGHPFTVVPAGINPVTGKPLSDLDRQVIADSAIPGSVHEDLMAGLRKDLSEEQVEAILDRYTIGKVAFTMKGYRAIVAGPDPGGGGHDPRLPQTGPRGGRQLQKHERDLGHLRDLQDQVRAVPQQQRA